jgi:hypothetical protein
MGSHHRALLLTALCTLTTPTCCGGNRGTDPMAPTAPGTAEMTAPKPRFTLDAGMMDVWGMKKTGPTALAVSPAPASAEFHLRAPRARTHLLALRAPAVRKHGAAY